MAIVVVVAVVAGVGIYVVTRGDESGGENQHGGGTYSHGPIQINSDSQFTSANGVTGGSGTAGDPYIIENWDISAENANGIWIENTTAYFIIKNCLIENGEFSFNGGIYLDNVINGRIENNTCENNDDGIRLFSSSYFNLTGNVCSNNGGGISLWSSSYNNLTGNVCSNNSVGIWLYSSSYDNFTGNTCSNNSTGIYLGPSSNYNILIGNNLLNNTTAPYQDEGTNNHWS